MAEAVHPIKNIYARNKNIFLFTLKMSLALGLIVLVLSTVEAGKLIIVVSEGNKILLLSAFGLSFINVFLQYLKWKLVCNSILREFDKRKIIQSLFYGFSAGSFTPARAGEYFGRAVPFSDKPILQVTTAVFIDKLFSMIIVLISGSVCYLLYLRYSIYTAVGIPLSGALLIYFIFPRLKADLLSSRIKWISKLLNGLSCLKNINNEFKLKLIMLSVLFYICFLLQFGLLIGAFSNHSDFINDLWVSNLVMFAKTVIPPVSAGEIGVREGASIYFLKQFGGTAEAGFNAAFFLFLINILLPAITGMIIFLRRK